MLRRSEGDLGWRLVDEPLATLGVPGARPVVQKDAAGDDQRPDAAPQRHRVAEDEDRHPDEQRPLHRVGHTVRKRKRTHSNGLDWST